MRLLIDALVAAVLALCIAVLALEVAFLWQLLRIGGAPAETDWRDRERVASV